jgi:hypothetical protein
MHYAVGTKTLNFPLMILLKINLPHPNTSKNTSGSQMIKISHSRISNLEPEKLYMFTYKQLPVSVLISKKYGTYYDIKYQIQLEARSL